ncbi:hypothetical protein LTR66_017394, partial [Elasticomyces elasticus]
QQQPAITLGYKPGFTPGSTIVGGQDDENISHKKFPYTGIKEPKGTWVPKEDYGRWCVTVGEAKGKEMYDEWVARQRTVNAGSHAGDEKKY